MSTYHAAVPKQKRLLASARARAAKYGRAFDIELCDIVIPDTCPVLKIPMNSPSLDRIDSAKGYVKGNVRVISARANLLKSNATVGEIELVLADLRSIADRVPRS